MKANFKKVLCLYAYCLILLSCNNVVLENDSSSNTFREDLVQTLRSEKISNLAIPESMTRLFSFLQEEEFSILTYDAKTVSPQYFSFHGIDFVLMRTSQIDQSIRGVSKTLTQLGEFSLLDLDRAQAKLVSLQPGDVIRRDFTQYSEFFPESKPEYLLESEDMLLLPYALNEGKYKFRILAKNSNNSGAILASVKYRIGQNGSNRQLVKTHNLPVSNGVQELEFSISEATTPLRYYIELRFDSKIDSMEPARIKWFEIKKL